MKIFIGSYRNPWDTKRLEYWWYQTRYKKYDFELEKADLDRWDRAFDAFTEFWSRTVCRAVNTLKNKIPRIRYIKIDKYDTWGMDSTLAPIILPMLKQLQETKHGAPFTEDADVPEDLRSTAAPPKENEYDTDDNHFKRWTWIMGEMIWAFEQMVDDDNDSQFYTGESDHMLQAMDANNNPVGEPFHLGDRPKEKDDSVLTYAMVHGPKHTQVLDIERMKAHHVRIDNGLKLFGKYFRALWD